MVPVFHPPFMLGVLTHGVDESTVPVTGPLCVEFDNAALKPRMPLHLVLIPLT